jgi:hypothetical protein
MMISLFMTAVLQGLFILMFFTCSKKVLSSAKERLCSQAEASTWRWSSHAKDQVDSQVCTPEL